ncbi:MAG TPA: HD domain-containing protein [Candidatus Tumulicola sp.]|jgi:hypothetical protein
MDRATFLQTMCAASSLLPDGSITMPQLIAGVALPDTGLANAATELARSSQPDEIFRHSVRAFVFAELLAQADGIRHDVEAVYVACIMHDLGLMKRYASQTERFEVDGANAARTLLESFGIDGPRADLVWDAIALHDNGGIARWKQPEVMLVNAGVSADFGSRLEILRRNDVTAVLQAAPRTNFVPVFLNVVAAIARQKPFATGTCFVTDVAIKMVPNFHTINFVDDIQTDPFAQFEKYR